MEDLLDQIRVESPLRQKPCQASSQAASGLCTAAQAAGHHQPGAGGIILNMSEGCEDAFKKGRIKSFRQELLADGIPRIASLRQGQRP